MWSDPVVGLGGDAKRCDTRRMDPDPDDRSARVIAANAGFEIVEVGGRVWFFDRRTRGPGLAAAISGGVAGITLTNGVLLTVGNLTGAEFGAPWLGVLVLAGVAALAGGICRAALAVRQRRASCPRAELRAIVMVDRASGTLLDGEGRTIAPLAQVRAGQGLLLASSAPALFLWPPNRSRIEVFRATLIGGGLQGARAALAEVGFSL
jgi:hypothetical protein